MEGLAVILILFVLAIPFLAIAALVKASDTQKKVAKLEAQLEILSRTVAQFSHRTSPPPVPEAEPAPIEPKIIVKPLSEPEPCIPKPQPVAIERPKVPPRAAPKQPTPPEPPKPKKNLEEALGGKIAGLFGVMILVAGIAFLVGSPGIIWPAPLFKILMGLAFGGILLGAGHVANRIASGKFVQLARTMTGGGGGIFYFCIFSAYSLYHLCGPLVTALGLTLSAALLLFLSLLYNSQVVATLGILGAFITPLLTGGDVDQGIFPLAYIALINLPVMFLGIKKNWQVLYNSAYGFTLFYFYFWMLNFNQDGWLIPWAANVIYFAEFIVMSLLIVKQRDRKETGVINVVRMAASTLFLLSNFYLIFEDSARDAWLGGCFAGSTIVLALLAKLCWKWLDEFKAETLQLVLWTILSAALLIFETTTDSVRGLLWCIQALGVLWLFRKPAPRPIFTASVILSLTGLGTLSWLTFNDLSLNRTWFNFETQLLLICVLLQSIIARFLWYKNHKSIVKFLQLVSFAAILLAAAKDAFEFRSTDILPWFIATLIFTGTTLFCRKRQKQFIQETLHFTLASLLCFAVFLHMALDGLWISVAWTLLGIGTAWFALKTEAKEIQNSAILIGFSALLHATLQPVQTGAHLILINPHTLCGLFATAAIGFQATLYNRINQQGALPKRSRALWFTCIGAVLFITYRNLFTALSPDEPLPWLFTSIITLFVGNLVHWMFKSDPILRRTAHLIMSVVPIKIMLLDVGIPMKELSITPSLTSYTLWLQLAMLVEILWFSKQLKSESIGLQRHFALAPLICIITLVSLAIGTSSMAWSWAMVSLWWGLAGLSLTLVGFSCKSKMHRLFALVVFAATIAKVLIIDCSVFQTGARVMILIGIGLLLLILSFIYQKVSAKIL